MPWLDQTSGGLPSPESWGPPAQQLQQDILDELSDHLDCALSRELRETNDGDEASARERVLTRFGNPRKLARSLWFAAIKEQVMSNRIMMGTNIVLAIAVVAICVFTISAMNRNNEVTKALLAKLEMLQTSNEQPAELGQWCHIYIRVLGLTPSESLEGYLVKIKGDAFDPGKPEWLDSTTDAKGKARFGPIRPGSYTLTICDENDVTHKRQIIAYPGMKNTYDVQWRTISGDFAPVTINITLPEIIREYVEFVRIQFHSDPLVFSSETGEWSDESTYTSLLVHKDGRGFHVTPKSWQFDKSHNEELVHIDRNLASLKSQIPFDSTRKYRVHSVDYIFRKPATDGDNNESNRYIVIEFRELAGRTPIDYLNRVETRYQAVSGEVTNWQIELPPFPRAATVIRTLRARGIISESDTRYPSAQ